jgi:hypothetical protein
MPWFKRDEKPKVLMNQKLNLVIYTLLIPLGAILFVFGEYEDSPGGQLIGLITVIVGCVGLIKNQKKAP